MKREENMKTSYPWKSFGVFLGLYLLGLATYYPVLLDQAEIYLDILGGAAFTPVQFAALALTQPILLGTVAIYFGVRYLKKVQLRSLIYETVENSRPLNFNRETYPFKESLPFVVVSSLGLALLNIGIDIIFRNRVPGFSVSTIENPTIWQVLSNIFYSGFGQEVLLRLGVMTILIYILSVKGEKITKNTYLISVLFTAILYAFSQQNSLAGSDDFNALLWIRHFLINGVDGILYGWLFYKFHFEAAAFSHMLTNTLIIGGSMLVGVLFV